MCIHLYVEVIQCSGVAWICDCLTGGPSTLGICAFFYMWNLFGVVVLHGSMISWWGASAMGIFAFFYVKLIWCSCVAWIHDQLMGGICHGYICILLYVKLIWCSGVAWIYDWLTGGPSALGICAFVYMWNLFGVVVLDGSMIDWWGVHMPWVYLHSTICETYLV